jgi:competence protein ComEA
MASSGCRARTEKACLLLGLLATCWACTTTPAREDAPAFDAGVELPAGPGREILIASCLSCHELTALPLFASFYTRDSWRALVLTMKEHGAPVDGDDIEVLADYLARHFGPMPTPAQASP